MLPGLTSRCTTPFRCAYSARPRLGAELRPRAERSVDLQEGARDGRDELHHDEVGAVVLAPVKDRARCWGATRSAAACASRRNRSTNVRSTDSSGNSTFSATDGPRRSWRGRPGPSPRERSGALPRSGWRRRVPSVPVPCRSEPRRGDRLAVAPPGTILQPPSGPPHWRSVATTPCSRATRRGRGRRWNRGRRGAQRWSSRQRSW